MERAASLSLVARTQLIGNLKNEMAAGFANPLAPKQPVFLQVEGPSGKLNLLYPANVHAAVPSPTRVGNFSPSNLLKWSTREAPFYVEWVSGTYPWKSRFPSAPPASPVSTQDRSANGKVVSPKRWNASWLLPKANPFSTDSAPAPFPIPDWVYLDARGAPRNTQPSPKADPIVGRYAYLVFDEGGVLDASVAGFASTLAPAVVAAKATARQADLRPVLEAGGFSALEAVQLNDAFVRWRDQVFFMHPLLDYSGVLRSLAPPVPAALYPGNRAPVSRQALLRLVTERLPGRLSARQNALQYLGTFSRSLAQPSFAPAWPSGTPPILSPDAGGNDGAGWNERYPDDPAQHLNPPFCMLRVKKAFVRNDETTAVVGEPLVKKRFSLSLLRHLRMDSVAPEGSWIEKVFGFSRAEAESPWRYRPNQSRILTLDEVADLPRNAAREPDFVELLKAGILAGALAQGTGISSLPPDSSLDEAVLQVAANIVDQADEDAFPTRIVFEGSNGKRVFSGIENLPYLAGVCTLVSVLKEVKPDSLLRPSDGEPPSEFPKTPVKEVGEVLAWQAFEFWNSQEVSSSTATQERPVEFRLSVDATEGFLLKFRQKNPPPGGEHFPDGEDHTVVPVGAKVSGEQLQFECKPPNVAAFAQPLWIVSPNDHPDLNQRLCAGNSLSPVGLKDVKGEPIFGVELARAPRVFQTGTAPNRRTVVPSGYLLDPPPQFSYRLEYNLSAAHKPPVWIPYDEKKSLPLDEIKLGWGEASETTLVEYWPDPRTARFGPHRLALNQPESVVRARFFHNTGASPDDYLDADGVRRRGAGASGKATLPTDAGARLPVLDRPFRSVGELAFAFAGTPWRQLDFATPESGFSGLLEVFCVGENLHPDALEVGRVNLNTRQAPVLQAVLAGADLGSGDSGPVPLPSTGVFSARSLAEAVVARTASRAQGAGPLQNLSDLVGHRDSNGTYVGLSSDFEQLFARAPNGGTSLERHVIARTLGNLGNTRVWNLLFDIITQAGRFPTGTTKRGDLRNFVVEAERRIWVHIAMDRLTGEVLEMQTEEVAE